MATITKTSKSIRSTGNGKSEPEALRKGIFFDAAANQFATRVGYVLGNSGERKRDVVRRLGADPNAAIVRHAALMQEWEATADKWDDWKEVIRCGLPDSIREHADLNKPVWLKPEWIDAAGYNKETKHRPRDRRDRTGRDRCHRCSEGRAAAAR